MRDMRYWTACTLAVMGGLLLAGGAWVGVAQAGPEVSATDARLDFAFHDPQRISVTLPGAETATTYWYLLYVVTNRTGSDLQFYPTFDLVTDTLKAVEGGADVHPAVYDAIAARHKREHPFFAPPWKVMGKLLQGEDNARTSAVVFREFDPEADGFTVYVAGLSSHLERVANPGFDVSAPESDENPRFFILRQTLAVGYNLPGDPDTRKEVKPVRRSRTWVMR